MTIKMKVHTGINSREQGKCVPHGHAHWEIP